MVTREYFQVVFRQLDGREPAPKKLYEGGVYSMLGMDRGGEESRDDRAEVIMSHIWADHTLNNILSNTSKI